MSIAGKDANRHENPQEIKDAKEDGTKGENGIQRKSGQTDYHPCQSSSNSMPPAPIICSSMIMASANRVINLEIVAGPDYSQKPLGDSNKTHNKPATR
jgi:hypothetical protein